MAVVESPFLEGFPSCGCSRRAIYCLVNAHFVHKNTNEPTFHPLTIHIIHLEEEPQLVHLSAMHEQAQGFQQLLQADGAAPVRVKQGKEPLSKEGLWGGGEMLSQGAGLLSTSQILVLQTKFSPPALGMDQQKLEAMGMAQNQEGGTKRPWLSVWRKRPTGTHLLHLESSSELLQVDFFVLSSDALKLFGHPLQPPGVLTCAHDAGTCRRTQHGQQPPGSLLQPSNSAFVPFLLQHHHLQSPSKGWLLSAQLTGSR